jgi:DNA-binding SARP family transcriptional activator
MLETTAQSMVIKESTGAMLRLQTFGGLTLFRDTENLTGAATQRRRLAILVLLAVAGDTGMGRDKLLAYLWPESDAERARHVLNQLLYAQRRQVGDDALFLGRKTLRLNPAVISSDVSACDQALAAGDLEAAVALYGGPFLDGFFLKDAPEFERWSEDQRGRLAQRIGGALRRLADRAAAAGDARQAADWWRRGVEVAPYDSLAALALVQALASAGDRAGALLAARRHEELLRSDLGVAPDSAFVDAVRGIR